MLLDIVLVVLFVLLCVAGIFWWARLAASGARSIKAPEGDLLEKHGVPVNRSVTRIRRVRELYQ